MALTKQAKICFRFLLFFHLGSFVLFKEKICVSCCRADRRHAAPFVCLFLHDCAKRDVEHVTLQIFPRESTWLMLKHDYFASEAVSSDLPVLCSRPSSISNRSSYKDSSTNTVKLSVTLGWDHIPHSVVSWLLGRGIPRKRRKCCFVTLSFCKKAVGGKSFLPMCLCFITDVCALVNFLLLLMISISKAVERSLPLLWDFPTNRSLC